MNNIPTFEEFINEGTHVIFDEDVAFNTLSNIVRKKLNYYKEKSTTNGIYFTNDKKGADSTIKIEKLGNGNIHMYLYNKEEIYSTSLADPKLAYLNTSARQVKYKTIKYSDIFDNLEKAIKKLNSFINKIEK